jgi:hypothetical protein
MEAFEDGGITRLLLMFHEPVLFHKLYIKIVFDLFQQVFCIGSQLYCALYTYMYITEGIGVTKKT